MAATLIGKFRPEATKSGTAHLVYYRGGRREYVLCSATSANAPTDQSVSCKTCLRIAARYQAKANDKAPRPSAQGAGPTPQEASPVTQRQLTPTASQRASAERHLAQRHLWRYVRSKATGVAFVVMPSSDGSRVHQVHPQARGCSCPAMQRGGYLICSHMLALKIAHEEDRAAEDNGVMSDGEAELLFAVAFSGRL